MKPVWKVRVLLVSITLGFSLFAFSGIVLGYGEATTAPVCGSQAPAKPWLYTAKAVGGGAVDLSWDKTDRAGSWTVAYGVASGRYIYGISNFGDNNSRNIRVSGLPAGTYYFTVRANNSCMPGPFSNEWSVKVGGGASALRSGSVRVTPPLVQNPIPTVSGLRPQVKVTPVPTRVQQPRVPTIANIRITPTPEPRQGFFQGFLNFFQGLFK